MSRIITTYLAGGIADLSDDQVHSWRDGIKDYFVHSPEFKFLDPTCRDYRGYPMDRDISRYIVKFDKRDIMRSDVVIANCPKPSWGTAMEVIFAHDNNKWVIVICPVENPSPWLIHHCDALVPDVEAAREALKKFRDMEVRK